MAFVRAACTPVREAFQQCFFGVSRAFAKVPSAVDVPEISAFWETKIHQRFQRMDFNQDGFVDQEDLDLQKKSMLDRGVHGEVALNELSYIFERTWRRVWSFGIVAKDHRVNKHQFVRGYTKVLMHPQHRLGLGDTIEGLLGGCFDIFDDTLNGERLGRMTKQSFINYQMRWNLTENEAERLFEDITNPPIRRMLHFESVDVGKPEPQPQATHITKEQYLNAARDFYFKMSESQSIGKNFYGLLRPDRPIHLAS